MIPLDVEIPARAGAYRVRVTRGLLHGLGERLGAALAPTRVALITDRNVGPLHARAARAALAPLAARGGGAPLEIEIEAGEEHKTPAAAIDVVRRLARGGLGRDGLVVTLGGGVVTDLGGFAAAIHLRGVPVVHVPTSLVAQVDAAIGGKTGVDLPEGKNLAGAFHAPRAVEIDPDLLETLPDAELRAGLGEVIKYAVLEGEAFLGELEMQPPATLVRDPDGRARTVARCAAAKARLCAEDEFDQGPRRTLNLGHTFGHALEAAAAYRGLRHGEAVALGMVAEAELAARLSLAPHGLAERLRALVRRCGLPGTAAVGADDVLTHLGSDKKRRAARAVFALPLAPGRVELLPVDDLPALRAALATILA